MSNIAKRIDAVLNSRRFFWAVLVFFVMEASWIALSAVYPQAFDENFHFGLIKTYSHYWLPFLNSQPPQANAYGAVARDPSYLYHYLMSFPYRLIALGVHGQTAQVIIMRFLNVVLMAAGLILFRRVLLRARTSAALTNVILLVFALIPVLPQLAGQINYDNMLLPLVAWTCLLTLQASDELNRRQPSARTLLTLACIGILAGLVKYEFLPVLVGSVVFLSYTAFKQFRGSGRLLWQRLWASWQHQSGRSRIGLVAVLIIGIGLFVQRDGANLVKYHTFAADCSVVLNVQSCSAYSPWNATYLRHQNVVAQKGRLHFVDPVSYTGWWGYWLWYRLFFAINGPTRSYRNYPPLPLPAAGALLIGLGGGIAVLVHWRRVFRDPYLVFFAIITVTYLAALWVEGLLGYHYTNFMVLMNGRYLFPILLPVAAIAGRGFSLMLRRNQTLKTSLAAVAILLFLQGGGVFTFIMRSDASWDWPHTPAITINNAARDVLRPLIIPGSKYYSTPVWMFN
jgi:hypothetical protein